MSSLTKPGSLGIYYADDLEEVQVERTQALPGVERVSLITTNQPAEAAPAPPAPKQAQLPSSMDLTGMTLGLAAIVAIYFLMK